MRHRGWALVALRPTLPYSNNRYLFLIAPFVPIGYFSRFTGISSNTFRAVRRSAGMKGVGPRKDRKRGIAGLWEREVGSIPPRTFADSIRGSEGIIRSLGFERSLKGHRGCVNTLCFNTDGSVLLSGSDDRKIILWDWEAGCSKFSFHTGHSENILGAQFMPWSNDTSIVTCSTDGEVRHVHLAERATASVLATELGVVHKMAIEPGSTNTFYTCSEYGVVTHFDLRTNKPTTIFNIIDSNELVVELYAIALDPIDPHLMSIGGSEEFTRIYDIRKWDSSNSTASNSWVGCISPTHLLPGSADGITGLAYSNTGELLVSYSWNDIYLFSREQVIKSGVGNINSFEPKVFKGHTNKKTVKGVYFLGPGCEYVASGSDSGHAFIWRKRDGEILRAMKGDRYVVNCIEPHPLVSVLATSGIEKDVKVWAPKSFETTDGKKEVEMAVEAMECASSSEDEYSMFISFGDSDDGFLDDDDYDIDDEGSHGSDDEHDDADDSGDEKDEDGDDADEDDEDEDSGSSDDDEGDGDGDSGEKNHISR